MKKHKLHIILLLLMPGLLSAQTWELKDPGGGGAVPAIAVQNNTDIVYVGSDVGDIRFSNDGVAGYQLL